MENDNELQLYEEVKITAKANIFFFQNYYYQVQKTSLQYLNFDLEIIIIHYEKSGTHTFHQTPK